MSDFTVVRLPDLEDEAPKFGLSALSFRGARDPLGCERSGLSLQSIEPGERQPFGHRHGTEEEIYVILSGAGRVRVGAAEAEVGPLDAIRVAPGAIRAFEAGPEGLRMLAFGNSGTGAGDAEPVPGWWGDDG